MSNYVYCKKDYSPADVTRTEYQVRLRREKFPRFYAKYDAESGEFVKCLTEDIFTPELYHSIFPDDVLNHEKPWCELETCDEPEEYLLCTESLEEAQEYLASCKCKTYGGTGKYLCADIYFIVKEEYHDDIDEDGEIVDTDFLLEEVVEYAKY